MPQIIVTAGDAADLEATITLRERINASDFDSERFAENLVERIGWAVADAVEVEQRPSRDQRVDELARGRASRELVKS